NILNNPLPENNPVDKGKKLEKNTQIFNESTHLKTTIHISVHSSVHDSTSETIPVCNIEYPELALIRFMSKGGFGEVHKGLYKNKFVAAKFVIRETPTQLRDFDREKPEIGMPLDYIRIYESCWVLDPSIRPEIPKLMNDLNNLKPEPKADKHYIWRKNTYSTLPIWRKNTYNTLPIEVPYNQNLPIIVVEDYTNKLHNGSLTNNMEICKYTTADLKQTITIETFKPLFESVLQLEKDWMPFCNVQLNIKIFEVLGECIMDTKYNVEKLKMRKSNIASFATLENHIYFQRLLQNITDIKDFIYKYDELLKEFNNSMSSLGFKSQINEQTDEILKDIKETEKFIRAFGCNFKDNNSMFNIIDRIRAEIKDAATNDSLFADLPIGSLNESKNGDNATRVERYCYSSDCHENNMLRIQITILKNLGGLVNIAKFYRIVKDGVGSIYISTEWSKYGNLKTRLNANDSRKINIKNTGIEYVAPEILERIYTLTHIQLWDSSMGTRK
ncbi:2543_t:CDS:2, partial [Cetraspora pellucida]